jgi:hypothetical protein
MVVASNPWETITMMHAADATTMKPRRARPADAPRQRPRLAGRVALLGLVVLILAACGGADPDAESSAGPAVPVLEVVVAGEVATLVANLVDPDGGLDTVVVDWGDGTSDTVTSGFPTLRLDHPYTEDGEFTIVLEGRDAAGESVIATTGVSITAFAAAAAAASDDPDGGSDGGRSGSAGSGSGGSESGSTEPDPAPSPSPEPAPEEPEPEPIPEPVTLDLLDSEVVIDVGGRDPTGTGASAEGERRPFGFGIRTYAWHGQNGSVRAEGRLERVIDARAVLAEMPDSVTAVTAEVSYTLDARAEVKGPWDRSSRFVVIVDDLRASGGTTLVAVTAENDDENPIERTGTDQHTGTVTTTLTRDVPGAAFVARGRCTSTSGSQVLAFFNEGYCDALEKGGVTLRALSVTFTPVVEG